jgi:hypothetical protein
MTKEHNEINWIRPFNMLLIINGRIQIHQSTKHKKILLSTEKSFYIFLNPLLRNLLPTHLVPKSKSSFFLPRKMEEWKKDEQQG